MTYEIEPKKKPPLGLTDQEWNQALERGKKLKKTDRELEEAMRPLTYEERQRVYGPALMEPTTDTKRQ